MKKYTVTNQTVTSEDGIEDEERGSEGKEQCVKIIARNSDNVAATDWWRKWRKKYRLPEAQPRVSNDNNFLPSIANTIPRFPTNSSISGKEKLSRLLNESLTRNAISNIVIPPNIIFKLVFIMTKYIMSI